MKRTLTLALAILVLSGSSLAFAGEEVEVYRQIYLDAQGIQQKYAAALNLIELKDRSVAPVLADALAELLRTQSSYSSPIEKETYGNALRLLSAAMGDYKYTDAAPSLWDVATKTEDPLARAEALMALGKMRALDYAERIALMLRNFDIAPGQDKQGEEKIAYGAIIALEKLKDVRGFMPVFYAMDAWYTMRVRQQAARSLPNIVADPTDVIKDLIRTETADRKLSALKQENLSQAPQARKLETAVLALTVCQTALPRDRAEAKNLGDVRKLALTTMIGLKAKNEESVGALAYSYTNGFDDEERLYALQALGVNAGDAAATALRDIILKLNADQRAGISDETRNRMAKAAVEYAGATGNKIVRPALLAVTMNDKWSGGIILAAQNAVKAIP